MLNIPTANDIPWIVNLSYAKRLEYSKHQPLFWKMAKNSNEIQAKWFEEELQKLFFFAKKLGLAKLGGLLQILHF